MEPQKQITLSRSFVTKQKWRTRTVAGGRFGIKGEFVPLAIIIGCLLINMAGAFMCVLKEIP